MRDMIVADTRGMDRLATSLRAASPASYKATRKGLRLAAGPVLAQAKANASYSSRIPQSGRIVVTSGLVVRVVFGGQRAPDAAPIENDGRGHVRHPTFSPRSGTNGEKVGWTDANSHPAFLEPARAATEEQVAVTVGKVVQKAVDDSINSL